MRNTLRTAVAVIILAMLVTTLAGCELPRQELTPEEAVAQAQQASQAIETAEFDLKIDMESAGIPISLTGSGTMKLPMASEMSGTMTLSGQETAYEKRWLGGKQYTLLDGSWWVIDGAQTDRAEFGAGDSREYFAYFEVVESTQDLGTQTIRGTECRHLLLELDEARFVELLGPDSSADAREATASSTMQVEVWIAQETGLPLREIVDTTMGVPGIPDPASTHIVAQIDFTAFDTPVEIAAPADAKPMPVPTQ